MDTKDVIIDLYSEINKTNKDMFNLASICSRLSKKQNRINKSLAFAGLISVGTCAFLVAKKIEILDKEIRELNRTKGE